MNLAGHRDRRLFENYFEPCTIVIIIIFHHYFIVNIIIIIITEPFYLQSE